MSSFALLQRFQNAILENDAAIAAQDIKPSGRLSIYVEGYRIRLVQAIRTDYPALLGILGDKQFDTLATAYVEQNPSSGFNLDRYPNGFCAFLKDKLYNDFALEVATLELAIAEVFADADSAPLSSEAIKKLTTDTLAESFFKPRTASCLLTFNYPVNEWLIKERAGEKPAKPEKQKSYLYAYRHHNNVQRVALGAAEFLLLEQLMNGLSLEASLSHVVASYPQHKAELLGKLQPWFANWLEKGFFAA